MDRLTTAVVQFQHRARDKDYNFAKIEHFAREAKRLGASLVVFPEMCVPGYWHIPRASAEELAATAERFDGPTMSKVARLSKELGIGIGSGWLELGEGAFTTPTGYRSPTVSAIRIANYTLSSIRRSQVVTDTMCSTRLGAFEWQS